MCLLESSLTHQVRHFVKAFLIVKEAQIYRFFGSYGEKTVNAAINILLKDNRIFRYQDEYISYNRPQFIRKSLTHYESIIQSVNALCMWESNDITHIQRGDYGQDILFIVNARDLFCITYFDDMNLSAKRDISFLYRKSSLVDKDNDPTQYIALFPKGRIDLAKRLGNLHFDYYCTVDQNGQCETFTRK